MSRKELIQPILPPPVDPGEPSEADTRVGLTMKVTKNEWVSRPGLQLPSVTQSRNYDYYSYEGQSISGTHEYVFSGTHVSLDSPSNRSCNSHC